MFCYDIKKKPWCLLSNVTDGKFGLIVMVHDGVGALLPPRCLCSAL